MCGFPSSGRLSNLTFPCTAVTICADMLSHTKALPFAHIVCHTLCMNHVTDNIPKQV